MRLFLLLSVVLSTPTYAGDPDPGVFPLIGEFPDPPKRTAAKREVQKYLEATVPKIPARAPASEPPPEPITPSTAQ